MSGPHIPERPAARPPSPRGSGDGAKQATTPELAARFRDLLTSAERTSAARSAKLSDRPTLSSDAGQAKGPVRSKNGSGQDEDSATGVADASAAVRGSHTAAQGAVAADAAGAVLPDDLQAVIDRMAAAIAESLGNGDRDVYAIDFPAGQALARSALVSRGETGAIHIRLLPADGAISQQGWAVARQSLVARLQQRRIAVGTVSLDGMEGHQPPDDAHRLNRRKGH